MYLYSTVLKILFQNRFPLMKIILRIILLFLLGILFILGLYQYVNWSTSPFLTAKVENISSKPVGLLLGTAKRLTNGNINLYYQYRIDAAVTLFRKGKIKFILVSGDNGHVSYNEPTTIQNDLIARGIPADQIFLDYAGFRTLDSVVRAREVFGQQEFIVISQPFHNARAVFIARQKGIDAIGFNARDVHLQYGFKVIVREHLARVAMLLDLMLGKQPKFLGEPVVIQ